MPPPPTFSRTAPAAPESVKVLRQAVVRFADGAGASATALEKLQLAVSEAVANAVAHAYVDAGEPGAVHVTAGLLDGSIWVTVTDDGRGMIPRPDSPGAGLGLPIIAQSADSLDVHRSATGGTEIRMSFRLSG